jgi:hypothetical protein
MSPWQCCWTTPLAMFAGRDAADAAAAECQVHRMADPAAPKADPAGPAADAGLLQQAGPQLLVEEVAVARFDALLDALGLDDDEAAAQQPEACRAIEDLQEFVLQLIDDNRTLCW